MTITLRNGTSGIHLSSTSTTLEVEPGELTLSGADVALRARHAFWVDPGALELAGANDIAFPVARYLQVEPGALLLSGQITLQYRLRVEPGELSLAGADDVQMPVRRVLVVQAGVLTLIGEDVRLFARPGDVPDLAPEVAAWTVGAAPSVIGWE